MLLQPLTCSISGSPFPKCPLGAVRKPASHGQTSLQQQARALMGSASDTPDLRWRDRMMPRSFTHNIA
jgi:hypothetical protein